MLELGGAVLGTRPRDRALVAVEQRQRDRDTDGECDALRVGRAEALDLQARRRDRVGVGGRLVALRGGLRGGAGEEPGVIGRGLIDGGDGRWLERAGGARMPAGDAERGGERSLGGGDVGERLVVLARERRDREIGALELVGALGAGLLATGDDRAHRAGIVERAGERFGLVLRGE